jgi:hypothetical protein
LILSRTERGLALIASAALLFAMARSDAGTATTGKARPPAYAMLNLYVTLDQVAEGERSKIGDVDHMRVVYDANALDPLTRRVRLINLQHFTGGAFDPPHPDPVMMPMNDAWLDLGSTPYRLHYRAAVTHGKPIVIEFDETTQRLSIRSQQPPAPVLISGPYRFDPTPVAGPEAISAATRPSGD